MLESFGLTKDPFAIVPDGPVENWAGRVDLKDDLIDLILGVRSNDIGSTEFLVLHGELGAGKSHALKYLQGQIDRSEGSFNSLAVYVERPQVAAKLNFLELYKYIIREIGRDEILRLCTTIRGSVDTLIQSVADAAGLGHVDNKESFEPPAFEGIRRHDRSMIRLLRRGASDHHAVYDFLSGAKPCNGTEYEGKVDSDYMAAKVLGDFLRAITTEIGDVRAFDSAYVFVDECEILLEAKAAESNSVFSGLRELINGVPYGLGLILSFTAATALLEAYVPQHLLKRMTHDFIEVPMLEDNQAVDFLGDQLRTFRPDGWTHSNPLYPFARDAIQFIVENQTSLTPRNLFMDCRRVLERAVRRHQLQPGEEITRALAEQILH